MANKAGFAVQLRSNLKPLQSPILIHLQGPKREKVIERFWSKIAVGGPDECWDWQAGTAEGGYGRFKIASFEQRHANRVAWAIANDQEPGDLVVRHTCDRPVCCNPAHLLLGTHADNTRDKMERGRHRNGDHRGERNGRAMLANADVAKIVGCFRDGLNNMQIARRFPVGHALVSRIRTGRSWQPQAAAAGWPPAVAYMEQREGGAAIASSPLHRAGRGW